MEFKAAQRDMVAAHAAGVPGVFVSGLVWLVAGTVWANTGVRPAFTALFFGGMLIVPLAMVIERWGFKVPKPAADNPLERSALEGTFVLFAGLLIAYSLLDVALELVFPAMAVAIGARYFGFRSLYGDAAYWALGGLLVATGAIVALKLAPLPVNLALIVGAIEVAFAAILLARWKRRPA